MRSSYSGFSCIVSGVPRMCMRTHAASNRATTWPMGGSSRNAVMSFTIAAPAFKASSATTARQVSIEIGPFQASRSPSTTGTALLSSSSTGMGLAPGRDDWPPTSMMSAPSSIIARACSTASVGLM